MDYHDSSFKHNHEVTVNVSRRMEFASLLAGPSGISFILPIFHVHFSSSPSLCRPVSVSLASTQVGVLVPY